VLVEVQQDGEGSFKPLGDGLEVGSDVAELL